MEDENDEEQNSNSSSSEYSSSSSGSEECSNTLILSQIPRIVETIQQTLNEQIPRLIQPRQAHPREYVDRDWVMGHDRLFHDYFATRPVYGEKFFRRRYRMRKNLFIRIQQACEEHDI